MKTTWADSLSDFGQPCDIDLWVMKRKSPWPIFHGPVILPYILNWLFDIWTPYFRIMSQYDRTFDLKINVGHCDLYFMVQWFCLINWFCCHHTYMWQQAQDTVSLVLIGLLIFWISQSDAGLHKFWISENKKSFFFIKNQYFIFSYLSKTVL